MSLLWCDSTHKDSMSMKSFGRKLTVFCIRKRAKDNQSNDIEVDEIMTKRSKRRKKVFVKVGGGRCCYGDR